MKIYGIDPSINGFAVVVLEQRKEDQFLVKSKKKDRIERMYDIITKVMSTIMNDMTENDRVFIEGYAYSQRSSSVTGLAELRGMFYCQYLQADYSLEQIITVAPTMLKKFITGQGNAKKNLMLSEINLKYRKHFTDDNIADAYGLAKLGEKFLSGNVTKAEKAMFDKLYSF